MHSIPPKKYSIWNGVLLSYSSDLWHVFGSRNRREALEYLLAFAALWIQGEFREYAGIIQAEWNISGVEDLQSTEEVVGSLLLHELAHQKLTRSANGQIDNMSHVEYILQKILYVEMHHAPSTL